MTATAPRSPRLLLITTVFLALAGAGLLAVPHGQDAKVTGQPPRAAAAVDPAPRASPASPTGQSQPAAVTPAVREPALPPHGEGPAGDRAIQQALEKAWPTDLPADEEHELLTAGRVLLRADAVGIGRDRWPGVFSASGQAVAPAFATARFRIQAAIARRGGSAGEAVVHLVWAGTDRGGTYTDGRITDLFFTRTTERGAPTWTPQPRT
ncbi:hypothetical protein ACF1AO_34055 [Streptomyces longwoodensis]|uniref:hypothetical protein n=1 Tax=Streptomyces longwoodensis TaxID=68231 RepID=UPI0036F65F53